MLVIEGKVGKSIILQQKIKELAKDIFDVVMIDYVNVNFEGNFHYCSKGQDMKLENIYDDIIKAKKSFENFKNIILEVNAPKSMLGVFKQIEDEMKSNVIVTIQNNELENIKVYEV